jgi:hypothetical protein
MAFNQRSKHVHVMPVERNGNGYSVYGEYAESGMSDTGFVCSFNKYGTFKHVYRN